MKFKRFLAMLTAAFTLLSFTASYAEEADIQTEEEAEAQDDVTEQQTITSNFSLPTNQRATIITPTVDFLTGEDPDEEAVREELDILYSSLSSIGLNTVYINTVYDDTAYFSTDMNVTDETDYSAIALEKAYEYNLRPYMIFDLNYVLANCEDDEDPLDSLISNAHRFVLKYNCSGIVIDSYYSSKNAESYAEYMSYGSGIGYENWLYDTNELYFNMVSDVIHLTDNSIPVGIMINDMWANSSDNEEGSETQDPVQALYDGYSDTRLYITEGYADFCLVNAYGSLTSTTLPFEEVTGWWGQLAEDSGITMYIIHHNERLGGSSEGWGSEDQLLRQLSVAKEIPAFGGSVFNSCEELLTNTSVTDNIMKFYGDEINEDSLFEDLYMQSPSKLSFVTYEPYVDFMGTFDENFDVYFNGQKIVLNGAGNFYFEEPLEIGMNTFTIEHKGTVYTYKIERKIITLREIDSSIESGKTLSVTGETKLEISCTAYKGSTVTATLNGKTISLKESESTQDADINSSYATFIGTYTVPEGIIGQEQDLGTILITASYSGYTQSMYGASVTVLALPEPTKEITVEIGDQDSLGSGEVVGTIDPVHDDTKDVQYVRVTNDFTNVYSGSTAGSILTPDYAQLPAGTLDYLLASSGDYYITESGKRFKKTDTTTFSDTGLGYNALVVKSSGTSNGSSYFRISLDYKISYNIAFVGNSYYSGGNGDFNLDDFTATQVYITFDNVTSVTKLPSFEYNYVFSAGKWETVTVDGIPKFRLVLTLRQPGVYAGCGATYNSDGDLELTFGITTNNIADLTIVIDPGHGYCTSATVFDPGAVGFVTEYDANLGIAKELESQLKALGVNVIRIKTESEFVLTAQRPAYGRSYGCDLFISIHANKIVGDSSVRGTEVYYFTPYSQPLASAICSRISSYMTNNVYSDGANKNRGAKYSYYWVTLQQDFPSVLIETGFVSNEEEGVALVNSTHQKKIAASIISGIQDYINRSSLSYSSDGSVFANVSEETETETTTATEAATEATTAIAASTAAITVTSTAASSETSASESSETAASSDDSDETDTSSSDG